jgi:hypothetical protein
VEGIGPRLFSHPALSFVTSPAELAYLVLLQAEIRKHALLTVQVNIPVCTRGARKSLAGPT